MVGEQLTLFGNRIKMEDEKIKEKYVKIIEEIDKALIESRLTIKQVEKEMEDIMIKARKNIEKLSHLL